VTVLITYTDRMHITGKNSDGKSRANRCSCAGTYSSETGCLHVKTELEKSAIQQHFSSYSLKFLCMTSTFKLDPDSAKVNQHAKYLR